MVAISAGVHSLVRLRFDRDLDVSPLDRRASSESKVFDCEAPLSEDGVAEVDQRYCELVQTFEVSDAV
jgi:hypothetical protein